MEIILKEDIEWFQSEYKKCLEIKLKEEQMLARLLQVEESESSKFLIERCRKVIKLYEEKITCLRYLSYGDENEDLPQEKEFEMEICEKSSRPVEKIQICKESNKTSRGDCKEIVVKGCGIASEAALVNEEEDYEKRINDCAKTIVENIVLNALTEFIVSNAADELEELRKATTGSTQCFDDQELNETNNEQLTTGNCTDSQPKELEIRDSAVKKVGEIVSNALMEFGKRPLGSKDHNDNTPLCNESCCSNCQENDGVRTSSAEAASSIQVSSAGCPPESEQPRSGHEDVDTIVPPKQDDSHVSTTAKNNILESEKPPSGSGDIENALLREQDTIPETTETVKETVKAEHSIQQSESPETTVNEITAGENDSKNELTEGIDDNEKEMCQERPTKLKDKKLSRGRGKKEKSLGRRLLSFLCCCWGKNEERNHKI